MQVLRQSTAVDVLIGPFVDLTDGATAETGESPSVKLSKNGQTLAAKNDVTTPVHDADGYYNCELDATDTNTVGTLVLTVAASANALPVRHEYQVVEEATYDFLYASGATPIADINAEVDTALTDYDPPTKAELDSGFAALNDPTTAAIADAVWDEVITGAAHNVNNSAAKYLRESSESTGLTGTAQSATSTTLVLASGAVPSNDYFNGERVTIIEGTGAGQSRLITDSVASTDTVTVAHTWTTNPDSSSVYSITGAEVDIRAIAEQPVTATASVDFDDLAAILVDTAEIGAAGAGLSAVPWNAAWDAEVQSEVTDALNAYDPPTKTEMDSAFTEIKGATWATTDTLEAIRDRGDAAWTTATGFSTLDAAGVRSAVGLASADLDTQLSAIDTVVDAIKVKTDQMVFTVTNQIDANIQYVNDVAVTGDGASGTEWGPA